MENDYMNEGRNINLKNKNLKNLKNKNLKNEGRNKNDRQYNYLKTVFTRDTTLYRVYEKYDPFYLQFFLIFTQMDLNNQSHKFNCSKMLHAIHNYLSVQDPFHITNPLKQNNSRLQYVNTKIRFPYYLNYSYIIDLLCVEGGFTKCMYGHSFNLLYRFWIEDESVIKEPSQE